MVVSDNGALVAKTARRGVKDGPDPDAEANARRICAAVNAVRGIPTEALEAGAVAELLAAAEHLGQTGHRFGSIASEACPECIAAKQAIARARTEAPPA